MRGWVAFLWAALALASPVEARLALTGFAPDLPGGEGDDAFEVVNLGAAPIWLERANATDGEGRFSMPAWHLAPGQRIRLAGNASAYHEATRSWPDAAPDHPDPARRVTADAGFALAQARDELVLWVDGAPVDTVVWGASAHGAPGWAGPGVDLAGDPFLRWYPRRAAADSDTAADWEGPQRPRLGWRLPERATFDAAGPVMAYAAPDASRGVVAGLLKAAERTLRMNVYEWRDVGLLADVLDRAAARPGLDVRVLVEAQPVGLTAEERLVRDGVLAQVEAAGGEVRLHQRGRYAYNHAKYVVVDERFVLVQTENLVPGGVPADGRSGNRGWGVVVEDARVAEALARVFDEDFLLDPYRARGLDDDQRAAPPLPPFVTASPQGVFGASLAGAARVTLMVGPEDFLEEDAVVAVLDQAREEVLVQHLRLPPTWRDASGREWANPYVEALGEAAARGVRVRLLLDGHFESGRLENEATLAALRTRGDVEGVVVAEEGSRVIHAKGMVVDGRFVVVGSANGNLHSVAQNREVSLLLDAPEVAAFFAAVFGHDWSLAQPPPSLASPGVGSAIVITWAVLAHVRSRRKPWSASSPWQP